MPATSVQQSVGLGRRSPLEREFERLYQRYVADVYRYALYVLHDGAEAEDVTQAAFLNAFRAFQRGDRPHKPRSWLLTIVHNECRRYFRTKSRRPAEVELDEGLTADIQPDADVPTPEEIRKALGELSFNQRSALIMRELEGRSYAEIAETLDLSVSAVETVLFRARRALREQLEGELTCGAAELALSIQLDNRLSREGRASLRAHLRSCTDCARLARRQRAQRKVLRGLGPVPLPGSLTSVFGGGGGTTGGLLAGGSALGGGVALKAAAILVGGAVAAGVGLSAALAGGSAAPAPNNVAPMREAAGAKNAAGSVAAFSALGLLGARPLADEGEAGKAGGGAGQRTSAPKASPAGGGSGANVDVATPRAALPLPDPVQLPAISIPTLPVSAPAPAVALPKAPVATPPVQLPAPTVPTASAPPPVAVPPVPVPPVTAPPVPDTSVPPVPPVPPLPPPPKVP